MSNRINMSVLKGEPLDGSGRVCIHLFVRDEGGPFVEPNVLHHAVDENGRPHPRELVARPTRGRLACSATRTVTPVMRRGVLNVTHRTDDPRAVTCLRCIDSATYREIMERITRPQPGEEHAGHSASAAD